MEPFTFKIKKDWWLGLEKGTRFINGYQFHLNEKFQKHKPDDIFCALRFTRNHLVQKNSRKLKAASSVWSVEASCLGKECSMEYSFQMMSSWEDIDGPAKKLKIQVQYSKYLISIQNPKF